VIPGFAMRLVLGEISTVVLDGQRTSSKKLESLGFSFKFPELENALADVI
jgi:NAD dependent epimerase/dehydratase family enzyme